MTPETQEDEFDFIEADQFSLDPIQKESQIPARRLQRYLQRSGEVVYGLPGDVVQTVRSLASYLPGGIKPEKDLNFIQRGGRKLLEAFPESEELRARSAEVRPELEPQSQAEEIEDEFVHDMVSLMTTKTPVLRSLGISLAGNAAKQGLKSAGFGESAQEFGKMGAMLFTSMFGKGRGINSHINRLYRAADTFVPEGETFAYQTNRLNRIEKQLRKGTITDAKEQPLKIINDLNEKIKDGSMLIDEAVQFDIDINRAIKKAGKDKQKLGYLKQIKGAHSEALDKYAAKNPEWGKHWKEAKQAYAGIATSEDIKHFIKKNANIKNLAHAGILLGLEEAAVPGSPFLKLGALGATASALYMKEVAKRLAKNPALRKYYGIVLRSAMSDNKAVLMRNLKNLERVAKKEFQDNPFPIFDIEEESVTENEVE